MEHDDASNQVTEEKKNLIVACLFSFRWILQHKVLFQKEPLGASKSTSSNWGAIDDEAA
jgi:hypothetical protein